MIQAQQLGDQDARSIRTKYPAHRTKQQLSLFPLWKSASFFGLLLHKLRKIFYNFFVPRALVRGERSIESAGVNQQYGKKDDPCPSSE